MIENNRDELAQTMVTKQLNITLCDSPHSAPVYDKDWIMLRIETAIVVKKGTVEGHPTVDLQLTDQFGKQYMVLATGAIVQMLAGAVNGIAKR